MPRLKHFDNLGTVRFITFACHRRYPLLKQKKDIELLLNVIEAKRRQHEFSVYAYVVMPNHVHLVLYPHGVLKIGQTIGEIKKESAYAIIGSWENNGNLLLNKIRDLSRRRQQYVFWILRCYDHNCRTIESVLEKIEYCHLNPVRAGLVDDPTKWPWSSYRSYMGDRRSIVGIDEFEA